MKISGVYTGVVVNSADPTRRGRVQVRIPMVGPADSSWAPVCLPPGGAAGIIPVGSTVVVAFEGGDADRPIVLGRLA